MRELNFFVALALLVSPLASNAKAVAKRGVAEDSAMQFLPLDPYYPVDQLPKNYEVDKNSSEVLAPHQRDQMFQAAGLSEIVKGWDHFEKDILFMRVKNENLNEVIGRYPLVPARSLQQLKRLIRK